MLSDLAQRLPNIGGPYAYARAGFGDFIGFWIGWGYWIALWSATAAIAVACVGYLGFFAPVLITNPLLASVTTLTLIWALTAINIRSMALAGSFQLVTTLLKIIPLLVVAVVGLAFGEPGNLPEMNPDEGSMSGAVLTSVTLVMWAFVGLEGGTIPADDIENPTKTIPRILIVGTLTVLFVYIMAYLGVMLLLPAKAIAASSAPFADAAVASIGQAGAAMIAIGAIISTLGALNTQVLLSGQVVRAISLDGLFPKKLGELGRGATPTKAIVVSACLASVLVILNYSRGLVEAFNMMILLSTLTTLIPLAFASAAALTLLRREAPSRQRVRAMVTASLAFIYSTLVIIGAGAETVFYGFILLMLALPFYMLTRRGGGITQAVKE